MAEDLEDDSQGLDPESDAADEAILTELRGYYDYDVLNWARIREEADIDVRYASNDTWGADDKAARAGRPMLNLDQLSQYRNQVENMVRMNKRGVKISPAGNGATDKTAELRANRIREIEYQSHAQEAYSQAFSDCLTRSYGFARIVAEYEDEDTDNQVFRTKAIPNPNQLLPDSDAQSTSGRDWKRAFFLDSVSRAEFKRDYPNAKSVDFSPETLAKAGKWMTATRVQIAEYWRVTETPNPRGKGKPKREVCMYLTNGVEILAKKGQPKKHVWRGKYIPFASCYGRIVYKNNTATGDSEKMMLSYIRFARDAAKGYNWTKSTMLEKIALPVRASLMGYKGQADNDALGLIERATKEPIAWIEFAAQTEATGQQILPLPQYGTREPDIQADIIAAEGFQRDIQNALGHLNITDARIGNSKVTSGTALQELKRSSDLGSYDFLDHYDDFIKFLGEQYDDLLTHYDDAAKEVATRLPDETVKMVKINTPTGRKPDGSPAYGEDDPRMDVGRHTITISTGPSTDSQRDAGKEAAMALLGNPQAFPIIAADAVRLMDLGPVGDQMAEDLEYLQPPVMQQARQQKDQKVDPRAVQQELAQTNERLQQAEQVMQQQHQELEGKQAEIASKVQIARMQIMSEEKRADIESRRRAATSIAVAHIQANSKGAAIDAHAIEEQIALGHEAEQAEHDRAHEVGMAAQGHRQAMEAADAGVMGQAALADQSAEHGLIAGQQAADLTPQPEAGA